MNSSEDSARKLLKEIKKVHHKMPRWVLHLILLGVILTLAYHTADLVVILLFSGVLAYMFSSIINKLQTLGIKRNITVVLLCLVMAGTLIGAELLISPYLQQEIGILYDRLPEFSQQFEDALKQSADKTKDPTLLEQGIRKILSEAVIPGRFINKTLDFAQIFSHAAPFVLGLMLTPFFVFFLLRDWPGILKGIMKWVPPAYVETTVSALSEINVLAGRYLRGLSVDCIAVGIIATGGLGLLGINYPITLGILSGCANVIPYMGPIIACITSCLIAFIQFKSLGVVVNVLLMYVAIKLIDDLLIQPLTIGKSLRLHPMLLVITIVTGEKLFGVIGMILAVPVVTITQKIFSIFYLDRRQSAAEKVPEGVNRIIV